MNTMRAALVLLALAQGPVVAGCMGGTQSLEEFTDEYGRDVANAVARVQGQTYDIPWGDLDYVDITDEVLRALYWVSAAEKQIFQVEDAAHILNGSEYVGVRFDPPVTIIWPHAGGRQEDASAAYAILSSDLPSSPVGSMLLCSPTFCNPRPSTQSFAPLREVAERIGDGRP